MARRSGGLGTVIKFAKAVDRINRASERERQRQLRQAAKLQREHDQQINRNARDAERDRKQQERDNIAKRKEAERDLKAAQNAAREEYDDSKISYEARVEGRRRAKDVIISMYMR
tara:strand:+ start:11338 stop:11682 length:345 start_codon:yes stop_codon:yes gene_type:complete